MMNSETSLDQQFNKFRVKPSSRWVVFVFIIVSFIGFLDSVYLAAEHYLGVPLPCSILNGCEDVMASGYATIWNVPVALFGAIYYLIFFLLSILYLEIKKRSIINFIAQLSVVGFLASVWFAYVQLFIIKALCFYCLISAITSTILFILGIFVLKCKKGQ